MPGPAGRRLPSAHEELLPAIGPAPSRSWPARSGLPARSGSARVHEGDRKSTRLNSSHPSISYAVFCLKKKMNVDQNNFRDHEKWIIYDTQNYSITINVV